MMCGEIHRPTPRCSTVKANSPFPHLLCTTTTCVYCAAVHLFMCVKCVTNFSFAWISHFAKSLTAQNRTYVHTYLIQHTKLAHSIERKYIWTATWTQTFTTHVRWTVRTPFWKIIFKWWQPFHKFQHNIFAKQSNACHTSVHSHSKLLFIKWEREQIKSK